jgi:hypothetical protein
MGEHSAARVGAEMDRWWEKVGSGAEAQNVKLVKSGEEDGWFHRVTVDSGRCQYHRRQFFTRAGCVGSRFLNSWLEIGQVTLSRNLGMRYLLKMCLATLHKPYGQQDTK